MTQFLQPGYFWALLLIPVYILWSRRRRRREALPFPPLQYAAATGQKPRSRGKGRTWAVSALEGFLFLTLIFALARPFTESQYERIEDEGIDIVLVLDVSLSMLAEDFPPNRLAVLQGIARDFVDRSGGHRVGVVVFAGDTYVQSPLTSDRRALASLIDNVSVYSLNQNEGGGTAIGDALLVASQGLERLKVDGRDQAVILITDGESNLGAPPMLAARHVRDQGIRLYTVGVGSKEPQRVFFEGKPVGGGETPFLAAFDDKTLRELADVAKGRYFRATDSGALAQIFGELSRLESAPLVRNAAVRRHESTAVVAVMVFVLLAMLYLVELGMEGRPWR